MSEQKQGLAWLAQKCQERKVENPLDEKDVAIVRALANNNLNATKAGRALHLSRNAVIYRAKKIHEATGANPLDFFGCCNLLVFIRRLEGKGKKK